MRLIDANAVRRWLTDWQFGDAPALLDDKDREKAIIRYETLDIILSGLDDPYFTIDAEPVRHGKWEVCENDPTYVRCSECGELNCEAYPSNYCPECGAKMDDEITLAPFGKE